MRIIVDAMGGDNAPVEIVKGALQARDEFDIELVLVGRQADIENCLKDHGITSRETDITILNADEVITMEDEPSMAVRRKKDSSMSVGLRALRDGLGDAFVSAGSTGALLSGATLIVRRIRGIRRAALSPVIPDGGKGTVLIDCGANVECGPEHLLQFAYMGAFYSRHVVGVPEPKVGLLNVGTEDTKGGTLQLETFALLKKAGEAGRINFIGNVEARDMFYGGVDVVVTDGFTGNVLLKTVEGAGMFLLQKMKAMFRETRRSKLAALLVRAGLKELRRTMDAGEVGGTPMLGISKPVIKAHGSSDARALRSAIRQAMIFAEANVVGDIQKNIAFMTLSEEVPEEQSV